MEPTYDQDRQQILPWSQLGEGTEGNAAAGGYDRAVMVDS